MPLNPRKVAPPVETRPHWQRDEERRALIEACCLTESGQDYLDALRRVADPWEWQQFAWWLGQALGMPSTIAYPHRQAKQVALGKEKARRRELERASGVTTDRSPDSAPP
jgi:hypothetical protein